MGVASINLLLSPSSNMREARIKNNMNPWTGLIKPFKDWCTDQQINYASLVDDLKKKKNAKRVKKRLTKGTDFNMPPQDVLQMTFDGFDEVPDGSEGNET